MVLVEFLEQWRGHDKGTIVELTDERAKELIGQKVCAKKNAEEPTKPKKRTVRPPQTEEAGGRGSETSPTIPRASDNK